jgi:hypothetical protein
MAKGISALDLDFETLDSLLRKKYFDKAELKSQEILELSEIIQRWEDCDGEERGLCKPDTCRLAACPNWVDMLGQIRNIQIDHLCNFIYYCVRKYEKPPERSDIFGGPRLPGSLR